jgi:hypothetical protein
MASYQSDFVIENNLTREKLVKTWAEYFHKNMNLDCNEAGYTFFVFDEGVQIYNEHGVTWDGDQKLEYGTDEYWEHYSENEVKKVDSNAITNSIEAEAQKLACELQHKQKEKERREKEEIARKEAEIDKERRRKQFEALNQEFGTTKQG